MIIISIKSNISRERAVAKFCERFNELRYGRLRIVADFYIPYRFFQMSRRDGRSSTSAFLAADAVTGKLDMIQFNRLPEKGRRMTVDTAMVAEERVNEEEAYRLIRESMTRSIFMKGFFKLSRVNVEIELATSLHIPYWIGVYERDGRARIEIVNALQGRLEGAKLREVVAEWFQPHET
ncbi:MAG TPA: hypothetical protein VE715_12250 [Blastocatellia bacterium]|nr:hypothetical protein [Blastocatellia bacterium]